MVNEKPLTINNLVTALKKAGFTTKNDLKQFTTKDDLKRFATKDDLKEFATKEDLKNFATKDDITKTTMEATDAILDGVQTMFDEHKQEINKRFEQIDEKLTTEIHTVKDDINGLKGELAITPARNEFDNLRGRVRKLEHFAEAHGTTSS